MEQRNARDAMDTALLSRPRKLQRNWKVLLGEKVFELQNSKLLKISTIFDQGAQIIIIRRIRVHVRSSVEAKLLLAQS